MNLLEKAFILYKFDAENVKECPSQKRKNILLEQMIGDWGKWKSWDKKTEIEGKGEVEVVSPSALTLGCGAIPMVAITGRQARVKKIECDPSETYKKGLLRDLKENENNPVVAMTKRLPEFDGGKIQALDDENIWTWHVYALESVDKGIIRLINPHRELSSLYVDIGDSERSSIPIKVVLPSKSFYEPEVVCDWIYDNLGELSEKLTILKSDFLIKSIIENKGEIARRYNKAVAEKEKSAAMADYEKNKNDLKNLILNRREEQISIKVLRSVRDAILERFNKSKEEDSFYGLLEINIDDFYRYFDTYEILELEKTKQ